MSEAKKKVMELIKKRQTQNKVYKTKAANRLGPRGIVLQFIEAMEQVQSTAQSSIDFGMGLEREAGLLSDRMKCIDPGVRVTIIWNREDQTEEWQDLQVEGVKVTWSGWYLGKHPFSDPEMTIDVASLFIEGYIQE